MLPIHCRLFASIIATFHQPFSTLFHFSARIVRCNWICWHSISKHFWSNLQKLLLFFAFLAFLLYYLQSGLTLNILGAYYLYVRQGETVHWSVFHCIWYHNTKSNGSKIVFYPTRSFLVEYPWHGNRIQRPQSRCDNKCKYFLNYLIYAANAENFVVYVFDLIFIYSFEKAPTKIWTNYYGCFRTQKKWKHLHFWVYMRYTHTHMKEVSR